MTAPIERTGELAVCVIGLGPRGLALLQRLVANSKVPLRIHAVDPFPPGGRVWRTDQSGQLLMNTVAAQVTVFPGETGPSLHEWARHTVLFGQLGDFDPEIQAELRGINADTYASRRLAGHYLRWVFRRIVAAAPDTVNVTHHATAAVALWDEPDGRQSVLLETGDRLSGMDAVALAIGHYPVTPAKPEQELAAFAIEHELTYILPANPADVDLSMVRPGEPTLLRGLGLCFFDYLALLTTGRGGRFVTRDGVLCYEPSGLEPRLYAGSPRGVPYQSRAVKQKNVHDRLPLAAETASDSWPLIAKEVETAYYTAQLSLSKCDCVADRFRREFLAVPWRDRNEDAVLRMFGFSARQRWDWESLAQPCERLTFDDPAAFREWLIGYLESDVRSAPINSAMELLWDLRDGFDAPVSRSHEHDLDPWYSPTNAFLSIGPPVQRVEQMLALIRAGILELIGPGLTVGTRPEIPAFAAESPQVAGSLRLVTAMIEARLHAADLSRAADPMLRWLANNGSGTEGLAVSPRSFHMRHSNGTAHPRRFVFGLPSDGAYWASHSVLLGDSDRISEAILSLAPAPQSKDTALSG